MRSLEQLLSARQVLMLQGPMGSFFDQVATWLHTQGVACHKVNFNGGDAWFDTGATSLDYRGKLDDFQVWLGQLIDRLNVDAILCFGDCRRYHLEAKIVCEHKKIKFLVFEEGYLRPDYITLENGGVNAYSLIQPAQVSPTTPVYDTPQPTQTRFMRMVWSACVYYLAWMALQWRYPYYQHHRLLTPRQEIIAWFKAFYRRIAYTFTDGIRQRRIRRHWQGQYYIVALQVHNDSQVRVHSHYVDVKDFIVETMTSFAGHALPMQKLVIKHHPMDRGYRDYRGFIHTTAKRLGIQQRVMYVCDVHLPSLIRGSLGLVTINSTTGLQALFHGKPVKVLGRAIYDLPQLTCQQSLDKFWVQPTAVDRQYYVRFRELLIKNSQLNGSFYGDSPWMLLSRSQIFAVKDKPTLVPKPILVRRHG
jgi:capsular polysaccharide export protein